MTAARKSLLFLAMTSVRFLQLKNAWNRGTYFSSGLCHKNIGCIPAKRDMRPVIFGGEGQCLSEAKNVPRAKPEALPRLHESAGLTQGI